MSSTLCEDCVKGVLHEGTPKGKWEKIGGIECYIGTPTSAYSHDKAVLFLPDAFGMPLVNSQLLVDAFAENGFLTIGVEYFGGDHVPADALEPGKSFDREGWSAKHGYEQTRPYIDKVYEGLMSKGINVFGCTGYCFGAAYTLPLATENRIKVAVIAHPSQKILADAEAYLNNSHAPLLLNSGELDYAFPPEACSKMDEIFGDSKFAPGYKRVHWDGCKHGFAVRGDMNDPRVKAAKEGAFKETVEWFRKYL